MSDFKKNCQKCLKNDKSVRLHTYYSKEYIGPCGDSFCYASCSMEECKKVQAFLCTTCLIKEKKDEHLSLDEHLRNLDKES